MPITPFHLGPGLAGFALRRMIYFPAFLAASVVLDLEPFFVILFGLDYPLHGFSHTFVGGTLAALVLAGATVLVVRGAEKKMVLLGALMGVWLHMLLDAPLYADIRPFWPIEANPLYGIAPQIAIYGFCVLAGIAGICCIGMDILKKHCRIAF